MVALAAHISAENIRKLISITMEVGRNLITKKKEVENLARESREVDRNALFFFWAPDSLLALFLVILLLVNVLCTLICPPAFPPSSSPSSPTVRRHGIMYCTRSPLSNESPASSSSTHQHHHQHSISSVTTSFTKNGKRSKWQTIQRNVKRHGAFIGPGIIASVAYIDPGNWATDLQAGSSVSSSV